jgi:hypothetical protein
MAALDDPILFAKYQIRRGWFGKWPTLESSKSEEEIKQQRNKKETTKKYRRNRKIFNNFENNFWKESPTI